MLWSITVTNNAKAHAAIAMIADEARVDIDYTLGGFAQVAETRDLKDGGAEHIPSGHYPANAVWFGCAVIAHNLTRWATIPGNIEPVNNRTLRVRIIAVPAVAVNRSRPHTLRLPTNWLWQDDFTTMLENLRALPGPAG